MQILEIRNQLEEAFKELKFFDRYHIYKVGDEILESTSKKIGNFYEKFPVSRMSALVAKKWNKEHPEGPKKSKFDIQREWKEKARKACEAGSRVHDFAEQHPTFELPRCSQEEGVIEWFNELPDNIELVVQELKMYSEEYRFSGTADKILINKDTGNLIISDWKTNEDIMKNYKGKKMKPPFGNLLDSPLNHYKIQLNHYKLLIESMTPFKVENMWIVWLTPHKGRLYRQFHVKDMTHKLIRHYNGESKNYPKPYI